MSELYTLCKTLIDDGAVTSHGSKEEGGGSELLATRSARCCWMMAYFHRTAVCVCVCVCVLSECCCRQLDSVSLTTTSSCKPLALQSTAKGPASEVHGRDGGGGLGGASWTSVALRLACQLGQGL